MKHNLRPEIVPKILAVLDENPGQAFGSLRTHDGCMCFEGIVCEAYRREHPDNCRWAPSSIRPEWMELVFTGYSEGCRCLTPTAVTRWATGTIGESEFFDPDAGRMKSTIAFNDGQRRPLSWFREQLLP